MRSLLFLAFGLLCTSVGRSVAAKLSVLATASWPIGKSSLGSPALQRMQRASRGGPSILACAAGAAYCS